MLIIQPKAIHEFSPLENTSLFIKTNNIELSTDKVSWIPHRKGTEFKVLAEKMLYIRSTDRVHPTYIDTMLDVSHEHGSESSSESSATGSVTDVIDVYADDGKLFKVYRDNSEREVELASSTEKSDAPIIKSVVVYSGVETELTIENYKPDTIYSVNSKFVTYDNRKLVIRNLVIDNIMEELNIIVTATEPGKLQSVPDYVTIKVLNLNKKPNNVVVTTRNYVTGYILDGENIDMSLINESSNIDIDTLTTDLEDSEVTNIKFTNVTSDKYLNIVDTKLVLNTKIHKVIPVDETSLLINGKIKKNSVDNSYLLINKDGIATSGTAISTEFNNLDSTIKSNQVFTSTLGTDKDILNADVSVITLDKYTSTYSEVISHRDSIFILDNSKYGITVYKEDATQFFINFSDLLSRKRLHYMFDGGEYLYLITTKSNKKIIRVLKEKLYDNTLEESDIEVIDIDFSDYGKVNLFSNYNDYLVHDNKLFMSIKDSKAIFVIDLDILTPYVVTSKKFKITSFNKFVMVNNEVYVLGTGNDKVVYKLNKDAGYELENYMSHNIRLSTSSRGYLVINDSIYCISDRRIIDIPNKKITYYPINYIRPTAAYATPALINNKLIYAYSRYVYVCDLDPAHIEMVKTTKLTFDSIPENTEYITADPNTNYVVKNGVVTLQTVLASLKCVPTLDMLTYDYITHVNIEDLTKTIKTITQYLDISKDNVQIDKVLSYTYLIK